VQQQQNGRKIRVTIDEKTGDTDGKLGAINNKFSLRLQLPS